MNNLKNTIKITIKGLVQGVGFRPFIYRIAHKYKLNGTVENNNEGVIIYVNAEKSKLNDFINDIKEKSPPASKIENIHTSITENLEFDSFKIIKSSDVSKGITIVSPDIAVCNDCLNDIKHQKNRINYPLTNCTNCGPRFTIIKDIPYDRKNTTMQEFEMCCSCLSEYENVLDRRFHAQPVACNDCGPEYKMLFDKNSLAGINDILNTAPQMIDNGKVLLIKGMGGYFLTCDAHNYEAAEKLRKIKIRDSKPFAVMVKDIYAAKKYAFISNSEESLLKSFRSPVVICDLKNNQTEKFEIITGKINTLGILLPYMPFHHLLFEYLDTDMIVFTSGNISDEPIITDDEEANKVFKDKTDAIISFNREIYNRADDSVLSVINDRTNMIRRSRGYVPEPVNTGLNTEGIFAAGAELVNTFAAGKENQIIMSQHIGDLKNFDTYKFYEESFKRFKRLFKFEPQIAVCDKHPDYLSSRFAETLGVELIKVQHHHAHMASAMTENGLDEKVIGVIMDGTGLGDDGNIWGSEFFIGDLEGFKREYHFEYVQLPGGDAAVKEPWKISYSYLKKYFPADNFDFLFKDEIENIKLIEQMLENNLNSPLSCGAGRLFDAVSALTGICRRASYHSQAPMLLESAVEKSCKSEYHFSIMEDKIIFREMFKEILNDMKNKISQNIISAKFHNTIISVIFEIVNLLKNKYDINKVVLSGGTFQNRYIAGKVIEKLENSNFEVFSQQKYPANDGGIAAGQLAIAAKRRGKLCV